jgi:hypothetical protein
MDEASEHRRRSDDGIATSVVGTLSLPLGNGLRGVVFDDVEHFGARALGRLTSGRYFWGSARWLECAQHLPGHRFIFLAVEHRRGRAVGLLPCQLVTDESTPDFYNIPVMLSRGGVFGDPSRLTAEELDELAAERRALAPQPLYPSLVAAAPNSYCPLAVDPELSQDRRRAVVSAAVQLFCRARSLLECRSSAFLFAYREADPFLFGSLARECAAAGFERAVLGADCVLPVAWRSFDEYLATFRSARRVAIKRERRGFVDEGLTLRVVRGAEALSDELVPLQVSLVQKYGGEADAEFLRATFAALRRRLEHEPIAFRAEKDGRVVGFILFFEHEGALYARATGFDHEELARHSFCYFNTLFYAPLEWSISRGIRRIHYGFATYDAKMRRGCRLVVAEGHLWFAGPMAEQARWIARLLSLSERRRLAALRAAGPDAPW